MKQFFPILVLVCSAWLQAGEQPRLAAATAHSFETASRQTPSPQATSPQADSQAAGPASANTEQAGSAAGNAAQTNAAPVPADQDNARKAKAILEQGIQALGGQNYLTLRDREQQGRIYGFHHGRPTGAGGVFWGFYEFPDKERLELTKERDIAELYIGNKGYEITFKGARPVEKKDLEDYLRRRKFSLETVLRTWVNDPSVVLLSDGFAIAAQHPSQQVTLINAQDEAVTLYFDNDTHLPVKKSFTWRDPVDKQKNLEEEVYENYRAASGVMVPYSFTRFFNGDMASQRFMNSVTVNQPLDEAMFDPNSGYNPNKPVGKQDKKH
jgi:hypothetical protein